jgi:hypothetical protein
MLLRWEANTMLEQHALRLVETVVVFYWLFDSAVGHFLL